VHKSRCLKPSTVSTQKKNSSGGRVVTAVTVTGGERGVAEVSAFEIKNGLRSSPMTAGSFILWLCISTEQDNLASHGAVIHKIKEGGPHCCNSLVCNARGTSVAATIGCTLLITTLSSDSRTWSAECKFRNAAGAQLQNATVRGHGSQLTVQNAAGTQFKNATSESPGAPAFKTRTRPEHS